MTEWKPMLVKLELKKIAQYIDMVKVACFMQYKMGCNVISDGLLGKDSEFLYMEQMEQMECVCRYLSPEEDTLTVMKSADVSGLLQDATGKTGKRYIQCPQVQLDSIFDRFEPGENRSTFLVDIVHSFCQSDVERETIDRLVEFEYARNAP